MNTTTDTTTVDDPADMWTVTGVWMGSEAVPVGAVRGRHDVVFGYESAFPDGLWAITVKAPDADMACSAAADEMEKTIRTDDRGYDAGVTFGQLGVDYLLVDEAHAYAKGFEALMSGGVETKKAVRTGEDDEQG